jgi:hypothetical protein
MSIIMSRSYYRNGYQHLEEVYETTSGEFEVRGFTADPNGSPYRFPSVVHRAELCRMSNETPWIPHVRPVRLR